MNFWGSINANDTIKYLWLSNTIAIDDWERGKVGTLGDTDLWDDFDQRKKYMYLWYVAEMCIAVNDTIIILFLSLG